jgi:hypothetical protein
MTEEGRINRDFHLERLKNHVLGEVSIKLKSMLMGMTSKRRRVIYQAILEYLKNNPSASNKQVWDSFPNDPDEAVQVGEERYSLFRDDDWDLYEVDSGGIKEKLHSISRRVFDRYVTKARDELHITTRRKKRSEKKI